MRKLKATTVLLLMAPALALAQNADNPYRTQGYIFIAPIVSNTQYTFNWAYFGVVLPPGTPPPADLFFHARGGVNTGFGGEVFVYKGLGAGVEAGYAASNWSFNGNNGLGVVSMDASYHFFSKKNHRRIEPFAVGGYSLYFGYRTDTQNGFNIGGGVNLWVAKHAALRLEIRDQEHIHYFHRTFTRFAAFRVGMTFR
jgi:hypothetical protein